MMIKEKEEVGIDRMKSIFCEDAVGDIVLTTRRVTLTIVVKTVIHLETAMSRKHSR